MPRNMKIAFFGSSLVSAYWNGAATYYRGLIRALHTLGHEVTFYESDAYDRQQHRDIADPDWARVVVYSSSDPGAVHAALESARDADLLVKASGVGVFDELLEAAVLEVKRPHTLVAFWDVDAPATLERVQSHPGDPFRALIPRYDVVFTYGGGAPVVQAYEALGARHCVPIYNALDRSTHHPVAKQARFDADLTLIANRLPDREARVDEFFFGVAKKAPKRRFLLAGSGWYDKPMPKNVAYLGHLYTRDHNACNCSARAVLNVTRDSMTRFGFSPATRVFEAAGAGACLISDAWEGIETFLEPDQEVLVARDADEVLGHLEALTAERAREIGERALTRVLRDHTYDARAQTVDAFLSGRKSGRSSLSQRLHTTGIQP
jgi:spore maturation protein CgeB